MVLVLDEHPRPRRRSRMPFDVVQRRADGGCQLVGLLQRQRHRRRRHHDGHGAVLEARQQSADVGRPVQRAGSAG
jgi:hypothetical protein